MKTTHSLMTIVLLAACARSLAADFTGLAITEIMYDPLPNGTIDSNNLEFIEIKNNGTQPLVLSGVRFSLGVTYAFPVGTTLAPGSFIVLASNVTEFKKRYPGIIPNGVFKAHLSKGGEEVTLVNNVGTVLVRVIYDNSSPWPPTAGGLGYSIVPVDKNYFGDQNDASVWRASTNVHGSPGVDDPEPASADDPPVRINEVASHANLPLYDTIELQNSGTESVSIGGWYLSDEPAKLKYRIPAGASIQPGGHFIVDSRQFSSVPETPATFSLKSHKGGDVYLIATNKSGTPAGFIDRFTYGPALPNLSFGRLVTSTEEVFFPVEASLTLGNANVGPLIGPIVINEVMYFPPPDGYEFIELLNISSAPAKLFDPKFPENPWKLRNLDYLLPTGITVPPGGYVVITNAGPDAFRTRYNVPEDVPVVGPYPGSLSDTAGVIDLCLPDEPTEDNDTHVLYTPYVTVEALKYAAAAPWPASAAGLGKSLQRTRVPGFVGEVANWVESPTEPTPGGPVKVAPVFDSAITVIPSSTTTNQIVNFSATAHDPWGGSVSFVWDFGDGSQAAGAAVSHAFSPAGDYTVTVTATGAGMTATESVQVTITEIIVAPRILVDHDELFLSQASFAVNWSKHNKVPPAHEDLLSLVGSINPAGLPQDIGGAQFSIIVNGTSIASLTLDRNGAPSPAASSVKFSFNRQTGQFSYSGKGLNLAPVVGVPNESGTGTVSNFIQVRIGGVALQTPLSSGVFEFMVVSAKDKTAKGKFQFSRNRILTGAAAPLVASAKDAAGNVSYKITAALESNRTEPIIPTGSVRVNLGGADLNVPFAALVKSGKTDVASIWTYSSKQGVPAAGIVKFSINNLKRMLIIEAAPLPNTGLPPAAAPELNYGLPVLIDIPATAGILEFEMSVPLARAKSGSPAWKR